MGTDKRERQKAGRQARIEAARAQQRKDETKRRVLFGVLLVAFAAVVIGVLAWVGRDDGDESAASTTTSADPFSASTVTTLGSAAGKPCVALSQPLPAGAPDVPVPEGPPPTELVVEDLVVGTGDAVPAGAEVEVNYIGVSCSTGEIFDSSWQRAQTATFPLDGVIEGWSVGMVGMQPGGQRLLVIPPDQGYGPTGTSGIAPDETLVFVVDLVSFTTPEASTTLPDPATTTTTVPG